MNAPNVIWQNATSAHDAGYQAVDTSFERIAAAEVAVICDAHQAIESQCNAGTANRATVLGAVAGLTADASTSVKTLADAFGADVGVMPPTSRQLAYAMLTAWWEGACNAARELADAPPVALPGPAVPEGYNVALPEVFDGPAVPEVYNTTPEPAPVEPEPEPAIAAPEPPQDAPFVEMPTAPIVTDDGTEEPATAKATTTGDQLADAREAALRDAPRVVDDVYANCVWLSVVFSRMGTSRTADVTATTADGADVTSSTRTTKVILSDCKEWSAIQAADTRFRLDIRQLAVPTSLKGIYPIPLAAMEAVEDMIQAYEKERAALVEAFVSVYDGAVLRDRDQLPPGLWDPEDYPPRAYVRKTYRMTATWKDLSSSTRLSTAMAKRNAEAAAAEQREAFAEVRAGLRVWVSSVLDELLSALKPDETGTLRRFTDNRITKMQAVIEGFAARDVTDDKQLQTLLAQTRSVLAGVTDVDTLRKDESYRAATAAKLDEVREGLRTLGVGDASPRKMRSAKRKAA